MAILKGMALALTQENGRQADESRLLLLIGLSHLGLGETNTARTYGQQAIDIAQQLDDPAVIMAGQVLLGMSYYAEGEQVLAYEHIQKAIIRLEQLQGSITVAELKTSFLGQLADAYTLAVLLATDLGLHEEAFHHAEQARARAFLDQLNNQSLDFRTQADADLLAQERDLQTQITARQHQLSQLNNRPTDEQDRETVTSVQAELARLEAAHEDLLIEIKVRSPNVGTWLSSEVDSLMDIQNDLDDQTTLVEYFVTDEKTLAFVITQNDFVVVPLPEATADSLMITVINLHDWLNRDQPHPKPLRDLYTWLAAPLIDDLNTPRVGIIPHQSLHYVPFVALTNGESYLSQQYTLFVLPSASSLALFKKTLLTWKRLSNLHLFWVIPPQRIVVFHHWLMRQRRQRPLQIFLQYRHLQKRPLRRLAFGHMWRRLRLYIWLPMAVTMWAIHSTVRFICLLSPVAKYQE